MFPEICGLPLLERELTLNNVVSGELRPIGVQHSGIQVVALTILLFVQLIGQQLGIVQRSDLAVVVRPDVVLLLSPDTCNEPSWSSGIV